MSIAFPSFPNRRARIVVLAALRVRPDSALVVALLPFGYDERAAARALAAAG